MARIARRARAARVVDLIGLTAGKGVANAISIAFDRMNVAEEEIASGKARWPDRVAAVDGAFPILVTPASLIEMSLDVYRWHARELIERIAKSEDTRPATGAEVMACLASNSLRAPLESNAHALYERLFDEMPKILVREIRADERGPARERWKGAIDELLVEMRRKLRTETRTTKGADE